MIAVQSIGVGSCWIHRTKETFETDGGKDILKQFGNEDDYIAIQRPFSNQEHVRKTMYATLTRMLLIQLKKS